MTTSRAATRHSPAISPSADESRLLLNSITDHAIFMLDADGYVMTWPTGAERIKGFRPDEIIGRHVSVLYPQEDVARGQPQADLDRARQDGRMEAAGWRVRKDGTPFWAEVAIAVLLDDQDRFIGFGHVTRDLTERRRAEEELRRSEERFRLLVETVVDYAIFMLDPTGHIASWNAGAERIKGYTASEVLGRHFSLFYGGEEFVAACDQKLARAAVEGHIEEESWRIRKDGSRFWASVVITALRSSDGELVGFAKVTRDLTERRRAEEAARLLLREQVARQESQRAEAQLRESEERYRSLSRRLEQILEGIHDGITVQDQTGRVVFANTAAAHSCGFATAEELIRARPEDVRDRFQLHDEHGQPFDPALLPGRRVLSGQPASQALLRVKDRKTGKDMWSLTRATPIYDANGATEMAINIWHDATEARRRQEHEKYLATATAALSASLDYEATLDRVAQLLVPGLADWCTIHLVRRGELRNVAVAHLDPEKVAMARAAAKKYPPDPARLGGAWNVVRTGVSELYEDVPEAILRRGAHDEAHYALLLSVGMKSVVIAPIRMRDRVLGTITIVSAESGRRYERNDVRLAEELGLRVGTAIENADLYRAAQDAAQRAEEASRIKDEFLATVSHELRTPLNAIVGWASLLRRRQLEPSLAKAVEIIDRNAHAQVKIVEDILDVSRIITGKLRIDPQPTDLDRVVRDAIEIVRPSALAKGIRLEFGHEPGVHVTLGDADRLQQVVWNLLSNAVKFTRNDGAVRVRLSRDGSNVSLSVSDNGHGIDADFLPYVFDRFKQADGSTTRRVGGLAGC